MTTLLLCRNRVRDFARWKAVFDANTAAAAEAGLHLLHLGQEEGDPGQVHFLFRVEDPAAARAFLQAPEAAESGAAAGVLDGEYRFLDSPGASPDRVPFHQITPFLHVPDLASALDRLTRALRFLVKYQEEHYAYLEWENTALRVLEEPGRAPAGPGQARMTVYLDCRDVDALYADMLPGLCHLPAEDVQPPLDKDWGQREFMVKLPDGHWMAFGMPVRRP